MHTRRVGAFLIGAWLLGSFLMAFVTSQSLRNVDRIMNTPPQAVSKEFRDLGPEMTRGILRYEAMQFNRHVTEAWEVMQLGLGAALLATAVFTSHRSRFLIIGTVLMTIIVVYMYFSLTPTMTQLERSFDFQPAGAGGKDRENHSSSVVWYRVLEIFKTIFGVIIAGRLTFDRAEWKAGLLGATPSSRRTKGVRRRRRISSPSLAYTPAVGSTSAASSRPDGEKVDSVDDSDDGRVDR
jgi:hypothetical protein